MTVKQPITVVELRQPRCALRFGVYPCVAALSTGTTRTNLATYSQELDNATWTGTAVTITANAGVDPDGLTTAESVIENTASSSHSITQTVTGLTIGTSCNISVFAKIASGTRQISILGSAASFSVANGARWNGLTGSVVAQDGGATASAGEDIGNGWWRFSVQMLAPTATSADILIYISNGTSSAPVYTGNGTSGFYLFGFQVETGTGASTYKATTSAAVSSPWGTASRYCHNTWTTCPSSATRVKLDSTGRMRWRFMSPIGGLRIAGDFADMDDQATPAIPVPGLSVRTSPSSMNVAAILEGKSPLGVTGTVTVNMSDFVWDDTWGDFYKSTRGTLPTRTFWTVWQARNKLSPQMELVIYEGYAGDALASMRHRVYLVDGIDGPSGGKVTIKGSDPLQKARGKTALFPPSDTAKLRDAISATSTDITLVASAETFVSATHGLTTKRGILIGSEIISYTGYTVVSGSQYTLTGVTRGVGGTTATAASADAKVTRCGHFEGQVLATIAKYLITDYTPIPDAYIDTAGWASEIETWLSIGAVSDVWVPTATAVDELLGELCQQGQFVIFWDEWASLIMLKAVAPPTDTVVHLTDDNAIISASVQADDDARLTRVAVYYNPTKWTDITKTGCQSLYIEVHGDEEQAKAGGEPRQIDIVARWVASEAQAVKIAGKTFLRSLTAPKTLQMTVDAKDGTSVTTGQIIDVTTRAVVDVDGNPTQTRWQVISSSPGKPGQTYDVTLQDYGLSTRRFCRMMDPGDTADYTSATDSEKATGGYMSATDGTMTDGSEGYRIA